MHTSTTVLWRTRPAWAATAMLAALLLGTAGCGGGGGGTGGGGGPAPTYAVGGRLTGLGPGLSVTLLDNGGDALAVAANGAFTFATRLATGAAYAVSVGTDPAGQRCTVGQGSGTVAGAGIDTVTVDCVGPTAWVWKAGSTLRAARGSYGTKGVAAASNAPGARNWYASWIDAAGDLWVFGGQGYDANGQAGVLSDLWKYDTLAGSWTWIAGPDTAGHGGTYGTKGVADAANVPGGRQAPIAWADAQGDLWLFGGQGDDSNGTLSFLSDLWRFSPATGLWTWVGGTQAANPAGVYGTLGMASAANLPGGRLGGTTWQEAGGNVWLFGGYGIDAAGATGYLGDLWKLDAASGQWTWVSGPDTADGAGSYGALGVAGAGNAPGGRGVASGWLDAAGALWLFGGFGHDAGGALDYLNDLWRFDPASASWTWAGGADTVAAHGAYGTKGTAAAGNVPGARGGSAPWTDPAGRFCLFGGWGFDAAAVNSDDLDDLWCYDPMAAQWTWLDGSNAQRAAGDYGTQGVAGSATHPGARDSGHAWLDGAGNVWLFAGAGFDSTGAYDSYGLNDLFERVTVP